MPFCVECGKALEGRFCVFCGTQNEAPETPPVAASAPPPTQAASRSPPEIGSRCSRKNLRAQVCDTSSTSSGVELEAPYYSYHTGSATPTPNRQQSFSSMPERDTPFTRHKGLFYTLRAFRELVPGLSLCSAFYLFFLAAFRDVYGDNFVTEAMFPGKHMLLDKALWMMAIKDPWASNDANPPTTPESSFNLNFTGGVAVDIYTPTWTRKQGWRDDSEDDWWCVAYSPESERTSPVSDGVCGQPTVPFACDLFPLMSSKAVYAASGDAGVVFTDTAMGFPQDDPKWACLLPTDREWPTEFNHPNHQGDCYSVCLDVIGSKPYFVNPLPLDMWHLILCPLYIQLATIVTWMNAKTTIDVFEGKPISKQAADKYGCFSLVMFIVWVTCLSLTGWFQGKICQKWWPGTPVTVLVAMFFSTVYWQMQNSHKPCIGRFLVICNWLTIKVLKYLAGVKSAEELKPKFPIDSDRALCFYLVEFYHTKWNAMMRFFIGSTMVFYSVIILFVLMPAFNPSFAPWSFLGTQITTVVLMAISIAHSLRAPIFKVDYRAWLKKNDTFIAKDKDIKAVPTVWGDIKTVLGSAANALVETEALRFLRHEELQSTDTQGDFVAGTEVDGPVVRPNANALNRPDLSYAAGAAAAATVAMGVGAAAVNSI